MSTKFEQERLKKQVEKEGMKIGLSRKDGRSGLRKKV